MQILNESIPHIIASLLTHVLATAWSGFQIKHTADFRTNFSRLATNGACKPINLLPKYWKDRGNAEIPLLALNIAALFVSAFLTWRLVKVGLFCPYLSIEPANVHCPSSYSDGRLSSVSARL